MIHTKEMDMIKYTCKSLDSDSRTQRPFMRGLDPLMCPLVR